MSELSKLEILEQDGQRVLTTQQLAEAYGTSTDTITKNFNRNKERYVLGKHYIALEGDEKNDFVDLGQFDRGLKNAKTLYLWTEKGTFLHAKSLNTDKAWEVYDRLVETYFTVKQFSIDRKKLDPNTQALFGLIENMARQELEQKRISEQQAMLEQKVDNMQQIMIAPIADWRNEINTKVREISQKSGIDYQMLFSQLYGELEQTAHCSLKRLQDNKKNRMEKAGNTKTAIKNETTKIAVIEDKPQLKAIFENIVRRYAMAYCA